MSDTHTTTTNPPPPRKRLCIIAHGKRADRPEFREAVTKMRKLGHTVDVRVTWEEGDADRFVRERAGDGFDTFVAFGGDGTMNAVLNGLMSIGDGTPPAALGILPSGTANDFAVSACLPMDDPFRGLLLITTTDPIPLDIGRVNDRYFLNMVSGGHGAEVTAETPNELKAVLGGFAYFLTGLSRAASIQPRRVHVTGPEFEWTGKALAVTVGNGSQSGGGYQVAPQAKLDDGRLDLTIIAEVPPIRYVEVIRNLDQLIADPNEPLVTYRQLSSVTIDAPEGLQVNLDGEPLHGDRFEFDLLPGALPVHLSADCSLVTRKSGDVGV